MPKKISIVTGPIVGLHSTRFIEETIRFAESVGEELVSFNLFDEILEQSGIEPQNAYEAMLHIAELFNGYEYQFQCLS